MSLDHPRDLAAWQHWQDSGRPLRRIRRAVSRPADIELVYSGPSPDLVVVVDAWHASMRAAVVAALPHLPAERVLVVGPPGVTSVVPFVPARVRTLRPGDLGAALRGVRAVLGSGHFLEPGATVWAARPPRVPFLVSQHGALTPKAPPLPAGAHLLAWSEADAEFWASGRSDVTWSVTGSQLLASSLVEAGQTTGGRARRDLPPVYLGQLHGAELPYADLVAAVERFCLEHGATYRPHPSERDRRSLRAHARWRAMGIEIDTSGVPLRELDRPLVSVFSTGVLEAAAAGLPAWVAYPDPPAWLRELWERYDMSEYAGPPTPVPAAALRPSPAAAVAAALVEAAR
ncbi:prephenate dehydrogenase [Nocardioides montaniterrae]